ncbi:MAG TPA: hypothetical protein VII75_12820 [Thermoanaerobaculia bacterium]|jgi:hypothetical protein
MSILRNNRRFVAAAVLMACILTLSSIQTVTPASHQMAANQEASVVGGFWCDFNDGVAVGLGVATLFGCVWCAAGAAVGGVIHVIAC